MTKDAPKKRTKPATESPSRWTCPACGRSFTQVNQRHACGTGDGSDILRNRPESVVRTYRAVEEFAKSFGPIELVARERYVLLRRVRIFADLVIMANAVRVAIHLQRKVDDPLNRKRFSSVWDEIEGLGDRCCQHETPRRDRESSRMTTAVSAGWSRRADRSELL